MIGNSYSVESYRNNSPNFNGDILRAHCGICDYFGHYRETRGEGRVYFCSSCRRKTPPDELRCKGLSNIQKGGRCRQWRLHDDDYCCYHEAPKECVDDA